MKSGPLAGPETKEKGRNRGFVRSQWPTLESGPLARSETEEKGRNGELCQEPVVHFKEWTTGWAGNWSNGQKSVICHELVDHWLGQKLRKGQKSVNFARNQVRLTIILLEKGKLCLSEHVERGRPDPIYICSYKSKQRSEIKWHDHSLRAPSK